MALVLNAPNSRVVYEVRLDPTANLLEPWRSPPSYGWNGTLADVDRFGHQTALRRSSREFEVAKRLSDPDGAWYFGALAIL